MGAHTSSTASARGRAVNSGGKIGGRESGGESQGPAPTVAPTVAPLSLVLARGSSAPPPRPVTQPYRPEGGAAGCESGSRDHDGRLSGSWDPNTDASRPQGGRPVASPSTCDQAIYHSDTCTRLVETPQHDAPPPEPAYAQRPGRVGVPHHPRTTAPPPACARPPALVRPPRCPRHQSPRSDGVGTVEIVSRRRPRLPYAHRRIRGKEPATERRCPPPPRSPPRHMCAPRAPWRRPEPHPSWPMQEPVPVAKKAARSATHPGRRAPVANPGCEAQAARKTEITRAFLRCTCTPGRPLYGDSPPSEQEVDHLSRGGDTRRHVRAHPLTCRVQGVSRDPDRLCIDPLSGVRPKCRGASQRWKQRRGLGMFICAPRRGAGGGGAAALRFGGGRCQGRRSSARVVAPPLVVGGAARNPVLGGRSNTNRSRPNFRYGACPKNETCSFSGKLPPHCTGPCGEGNRKSLYWPPWREPGWHGGMALHGSLGGGLGGIGNSFSKRLGNTEDWVGHLEEVRWVWPRLRRKPGVLNIPLAVGFR